MKKTNGKSWVRVWRKAHCGWLLSLPPGMIYTSLGIWGFHVRFLISISLTSPPSPSFLLLRLKTLALFMSSSSLISSVICTVLVNVHLPTYLPSLPKDGQADPDRSLRSDLSACSGVPQVRL